jgi:hypothetical protein
VVFREIEPFPEFERPQNILAESDLYDEGFIINDGEVSDNFVLSISVIDRISDVLIRGFIMHSDHRLSTIFNTY